MWIEVAITCPLFRCGIGKACPIAQNTTHLIAPSAVLLVMRMIWSFSQARLLKWANYCKRVNLCGLSTRALAVDGMVECALFGVGLVLSTRALVAKSTIKRALWQDWRCGGGGGESTSVLLVVPFTLTFCPKVAI